MKWNFYTALVGILFISLASGAEDMQCVLTETHGPRIGTEYAIRSSLTQNTCEGRQTRSGAGDWKKIPIQACQRISALLKQNENGLQNVAEKQENPNYRYPRVKTPKARLGILRCGTGHWNVSLDTAETCDVTMTRCESPKIDSASQLALELRTVLTENLGRLN